MDVGNPKGVTREAEREGTREKRAARKRGKPRTEEKV